MCVCVCVCVRVRVRVCVLLNGVSHRNYVELRNVAYRLRRVYSTIRCAYLAIRRGAQKSTRDGHTKIKHV